MIGQWLPDNTLNTTEVLSSTTDSLLSIAYGAHRDDIWVGAAADVARAVKSDEYEDFYPLERAPITGAVSNAYAIAATPSGAAAFFSNGARQLWSFDGSKFDRPLATSAVLRASCVYSESTVWFAGGGTSYVSSNCGK